jgi:uncharacterized protein YjcR
MEVMQHMSGRTKRKRGGQPDNQNARRHGFYSDYFDPRQVREFKKIIKKEGVSPQVAAIRIKLDSVLGSGPVNRRLLREARHLLVNYYASEGNLSKEDRSEIKRFVRAIFKNAGANQLPTKLIKQSVNTAANQAETPVSVPKCRNQSSRIEKKT